MYATLSAAYTFALLHYIYPRRDILTLEAQRNMFIREKKSLHVLLFVDGDALSIVTRSRGSYACNLGCE